MTTRKQQFDMTSLRRWYAIGGLFTPYYMTPAEGGTPVGCQSLAVQDVESQCFIEHWSAPRKPAAFTADEIMGFTDIIFAKHGRPRDGLLILPSVWRSSKALHDDDFTRGRVAEAVSWGLSWPEMLESERLKIALRIQSLGIALAWDEDDIPNKEQLICG